MTRLEAKRKIESLLRMKVSRGATPAEEATARRLAEALASKFGFSIRPLRTEWRPDFDQRFARAEKRAGMRFNWEYRRCWKPRCHCMRTSGQGHGPYRYGKKRSGRRVHSIYLGR